MQNENPTTSMLTNQAVPATQPAPTAPAAAAPAAPVAPTSQTAQPAPVAEPVAPVAEPAANEGPSAVPTSSSIAAAAAAAATPTAVPTSVRIETLLEECIRKNASDLHIQVGLPPILRVDGALQPIPNTPVLTEDMLEKLVFSTLDSMQRETLSKDKEFDYSFSFGDVARFRVNAFNEKVILQQHFV